MEIQEKPKKKKKSILTRLLKIFGWIVLTIVGLVILALILIQLPFVQNFGRKKIVSYLENKLHTRVAIGKLDIDFPTALSLQQVYFEDQAKDTLLYGDKIKVNISMLRLLRNEVKIKGIYLDGVVANMHRQPPDSVFNFQFIIDAFTSDQTKKPEQEDTAMMKMSIDEIVVDNSHFVYKDLYTGNDLDLKLNHFKTEIKTFDPGHLLFDISLITVDGAYGHFYQLEPMQKPIEDIVTETSEVPGNVMQLISKSILLSDINFQFNSDASHLKSSYIIGNAALHPKTIDLKNMLIALKDASLKNSDVVIETNPALTDKPPLDTVADAAPPPLLKILADALTLENTSFKMDDLSKPPAPSGMDFSHLDLSGIHINAENLLYSADTMRAQVLSAGLQDRSGFVLNDMKAGFEMNPTGVTLSDLYIKTPGTEIKKSIALSYPSLEALQANPGALDLNVDLDNSTIAVKDLLLFLPQMQSQLSSLKDESLLVDTRLTGTVSNLQLQKVILKGLSGTNVNLHGTLTGLPDPGKINTNLTITTFTTTKKDINAFLPAGTLPSNIQLPSRMNASGIVRGGMNDLYTDLGIQTDMGNARVSGTLANITDQQNARYNMMIAAQGLQLGHILTNPELGSFTGKAGFRGKGLEPKTADATFNINVPEVGYHQYRYHNILADGAMRDGQLNTDLRVSDPNLSTTISLNGSFSGKYPSIALQGVIDSVDAMALNFSTSPLKYHGRVFADFSNTNPDSLNGTLVISKSILATGNQRLTIDSISVVAVTSDTNSIAVNTGFASLNLQGQYKLTQLGDVFINAINPYFKITDSAGSKEPDPYHFTLTGIVYDNPALKAVLPGLESMKTLQLGGTFDSDSGWNFGLTAPHIDYQSMVIDSVYLAAATADTALGIQFTMNRFTSGSSIDVYQASIDGTLAHNTLNMALGILDKGGKQKYFLRGSILQNNDGDYAFSLLPDSLRLNYEKWDINPQNQITFGKEGIVAQNFVLRQDDQQLSVNNETPDAAAPLKLAFSNFKISTLTGFVQTDSLLVNGLLNGNATVRNLQTQPTFVADITVNDLSVYEDTLGVLTAKVNNEISNQYNAAITLQGNGNDITINGNYFTKSQNSSFDFLININKFAMESLEGLTNGAIRDAHGFVYGNIKVNGNLENRNIDGRLQFDNTSFVPAALNNVFKIDKEALAIVNNEGIRFNSFTIRDTANNTLTLGGMVHTTDWQRYSFDMTVRANNFQAINSTKKDNDLFYGKLVFSTRLSIKGTPENPVIDGNLAINEKTQFTVVLPQEDPGISKREGVVRFVDYSATPEDSLFMAPYDSLKQAPLRGYDVAVNITIDKEAEFNLIVDAANGDFLHLRGTGELSGGIDPSGKVNLTGSYEIEEGSYSLSFNFLKRKFLIQQGSRIVWTGDPTSAQVDVTAVYVANTAPFELVQGMIQENDIYYKQKLPFEVHLNMDGELLKPQITFDIVLPDKNYTVSTAVTNNVEQRLVQLRQEPSELNKQVFALLLLNRFIGENPFNNSSGGMDAGTFAKQSASRLLTEQLNSLTEGLIQGVDLNFDLATTEDYTTGEKRDRTDFKVGITKRLLNDRLTVSVGNNFEVEGPQPTNEKHSGIADNISINYSLSKDGRYMLRAYRTNDYTGAIEGYVIETGVSFIITLDYNKLSQIFRSKKEREKKREVRRRNKEMTRNNEQLNNDQRETTPPMQQENKNNNDQ